MLKSLVAGRPINSRPALSIDADRLRDGRKSRKRAESIEIPASKACVLMRARPSSSPHPPHLAIQARATKEIVLCPRTEHPLIKKHPDVEYPLETRLQGLALAPSGGPVTGVDIIAGSVGRSGTLNSAQVSCQAAEWGASGTQAASLPASRSHGPLTGRLPRESLTSMAIISRGGGDTAPRHHRLLSAHPRRPSATPRTPSGISFSA